VWILVMRSMEWHRECMEGMAEPSMDEVFQEGPNQHPHYEQGDSLNHGRILSDLAQKGRYHRLCNLSNRLIVSRKQCS
jgi:hypothetical protein